MSQNRDANLGSRRILSSTARLGFVYTFHRFVPKLTIDTGREVWPGRAQTPCSSQARLAERNPSRRDLTICSVRVREHSGHGLPATRSLPRPYHQKSQDLQEERNHADRDGDWWKQTVFRKFLVTWSLPTNSILTSPQDLFVAMCNHIDDIVDITYVLPLLSHDAFRHTHCPPCLTVTIDLPRPSKLTTQTDENRKYTRELGA